MSEKRDVTALPLQERILRLPFPKDCQSHPTGSGSTSGLGVGPQLIPVMVRGGRVHAPSKYRVHGEYETFEEAAEVVYALRRDPEIVWAYIPDEYAKYAKDRR